MKNAWFEQTKKVDFIYQILIYPEYKLILLYLSEQIMLLKWKNNIAGDNIIIFFSF